MHFLVILVEPKWSTNSPSQYTPIILIFLFRPDIFLGSGTFKKSGTLLFAKSRVQKNRVIVIQKEKRPGCLFSFWITKTLVFYTLLFSKSRVPNFFQGHKPTLVFKTRIVGADWLGDCLILCYFGLNYWVILVFISRINPLVSSFSTLLWCTWCAAATLGT